MRKTSAIMLAFILLSTLIFGQESSLKQPATLGIHFIFNDFATAKAIRTSSLSAVLREGRLGKLKDMQQGLALSYGKGLSANFDFYSMFTGSFLSYPFENKPATSGDFLLLEADASIRGKLLNDKHWFVPFMQIGVGVSKYKGYWGTFMPIGAGIQINFFDEAYLLINSQYRMAVTETSSYHFVHSIGLVGNIGKR